MKFHTQHERSTFDNILPSAAMGSTEEAGAQPQLHQIPPGSVHLRLQLPQLAHHRPEHRHHQPRRERPGQLHGAALLPASGRAGLGFSPRASPTRPPLTHPGRAPRSGRGTTDHRGWGGGWTPDPPTQPTGGGGSSGEDIAALWSSRASFRGHRGTHGAPRREMEQSWKPNRGWKRRGKKRRWHVWLKCCCRTRFLKDGGCGPIRQQHIQFMQAPPTDRC